MQKHESDSQNVEEQNNENLSKNIRDQAQNQQEAQKNNMSASLPTNSQQKVTNQLGINKAQVKDSKLQTQTKVQTSLQNISIESPVKRPIVKNEAKLVERVEILKQKMSQKGQVQVKQPASQDFIVQPKIDSQSHMKSTVKSSHRLIKKANKPFYEQTFYITGMKENYLLLLSDANQVLEFPIGMFTTQGESGEGQKQLNETSSNKADNYHLIKDIKIGQAIKIKLEFDFLRQQKDDRLFLSLQRNINAQYSQANQQQHQSPRGNNKEILLRKPK